MHLFKKDGKNLIVIKISFIILWIYIITKYLALIGNGINRKKSIVLGNNIPNATNNPNRQPEAPKTTWFVINNSW